MLKEKGLIRVLYAMRRSYQTPGSATTPPEDAPGLCIVVLLCWLVSCDGEVSEDEWQELRAIADAASMGGRLDQIIKRTRAGDPEFLIVACKTAHVLSSNNKRLLLEMAVTLALKDGYLRHPEMHVLAFIADLVGLGKEGLATIFRELTTHEYPPLGDMSNPQWWRVRDSGSRYRPGEAEGERSGRVSHELRKALGVLGLDEDASQTEIRQAYLRLVAVHHPDKFASLGPAAVEAATVTFRRIQWAYRIASGRT